MAGLYVAMLDSGFDAAYLDRCTLLDIDVFARALDKRSKQQPTGRQAARAIR